MFADLAMQMLAEASYAENACLSRLIDHVLIRDPDSVPNAWELPLGPASLPSHDPARQLEPPDDLSVWIKAFDSTPFPLVPLALKLSGYDLQHHIIPHPGWPPRNHP